MNNYIETLGICGKKVMISVDDILYAHGFNYADSQEHTTIQFKNGKKICVWCNYSEFKTLLKDKCNLDANLHV